MIFSLLPASPSVFGDNQQDTGDEAVQEEAAQAPEGGVAVNEDDIIVFEPEAEPEAEAVEAAAEEPAAEDEPAIAAEDEGDEEAILEGEDEIAPLPSDEEEPIINDGDVEDIDDETEPATEPEIDEIILPEGGVLGVGDEYLVEYYIGATRFTVQLVVEGAKARNPGTPPADKFPSGMVSFLGWYESGASDESPYDFDKPVMSDLNLFARFSDMYLAQFHDGFKKIYLSQRVPQGSAVSPPTGEVPMPPDKMFDGWSESELAPQPDFNFTLPITKDVYLYPKAADKVYVFFVSYTKDQVPTASLKKGQAATAPVLPPYREKYTFNHWTTTPGGEGPAYNFATPVDSNLTLYASYTGIPNSATYKVVWWVEAPNFKGTPTPGNGNDYIYAEEEIRVGTPGALVSVNTLPPYVGERPIYDPLRYAEFQYGAPTRISSQNNTIVNVYLTRKTYRIIFAQYSADTSFEFFTGGKYHSSQYYIDFKYEMNVTDIWPCSATANFVGLGPNGKGFHSWVTPDDANVGYNMLWLTRRNVISDEMMPTDPNGPGYTVEAFYLDSGKYIVRYWLEAYPGQTGTERIYKGKRYIVDRQYDQSNVPELVPKSINGTNTPGIDYSDSESGPGYAERGTHVYENIYYNRNIHDLLFDMGGAPSIAPVRNIMYDEPLAKYEPKSIPTWPGYTFVGWYKDGNRTLPFDFSTARMTPNTNLSIFAKWESQDYTVSFYDGDELLGTRGVKEGDVVDFNNPMFNGILYEIGLEIKGKGVMIGWQFDPIGLGFLSPYPVDMPVYSDLKLYVHWRTTGFKVIYKMGDAASGSVVPVDPETYSIGTYARVLRGNMIAPISGEMFIGWRVDEVGIIYYPGSSVRILSDMYMYPFFAKAGDIAYLTLDNNYPANPEKVTREVAKNANAPLPDASIFTKVPPNSTLIGWSLSKDTGPVFPPYGTYFIGVDPVTLYAHWVTDNVKIVFDGNGDTKNTSKEEPVLRNTMVDVYLIAPKNLEKIGRDFIGWSLQRDNRFSLITSPILVTADVTYVYALWSPEKSYRTVMFNGNGDVDNTMKPEQVEVHDTVSLNALGPKNLIKVGYDHTGWSLVANVGPKVDTYKVDNDVEVFAFYELAYVNVIWNGNGDDNNTKLPVQIPKHTEFKDANPPDVKKDGYDLIGWTTKKDDKSTLVGPNDRLSTDVELFAYWELSPEVELTYHGNGGFRDGNIATYTTTVPGNSYIELAHYITGPYIFYRAGYIFDGWSTVKDPPYNVKTHIQTTTVNVDVYATWVKVDDIDFIFDGNGGTNDAGKTEFIAQVEVNSSVNISLIEPKGADAFKKPGFKLAGWSTEKDNPLTEVKNVFVYTTPFKVFALWDIAPDVEVKFNGNGGKNFYGSDEFIAEVKANSTVPITSIEPQGNDKFYKTGHIQDGWTFDKDDATTKITNLPVGTDPIEIFAFWKKVDDVKLIFDGNGGANKSNQTEFPVDVPVYSDQVLATKQPTGDDMFTNPGFKFVGWGLKADDKVPVLNVKILEANVRVFAIWSAVGDVKLIFDANGGVNKNNATSYFVFVKANSTQNLVALQPTGNNIFRKAGYTQAGWLKDKNDENSVITTADILEADYTVYALWVVAPKVMLTFDANGGENKNGKNTFGVAVDVWSKQNLADLQPTGNDEFKRAGFERIGWTTTKDDNKTVKTTIDIEDANVTVFALWRAVNDVSLTFDGNGGYNKAGAGSITVYVPANSNQLLSDWEPKGDDMFMKPGYSFQGWTTEKDDPATKIDDLDFSLSGKVVYALWKVEPDVKITFDGNGGTNKAGNSSIDVPVPVNSTQYLADIEPKGDNMFKKSGKIFSGWTLEKDDATKTVTFLDVKMAGIKVYALWTDGGDAVIIFNGNGGKNKDGAGEVGVLVPVNSNPLLSDIQPTGDKMFKKPGFIFKDWTTEPDDATTVVKNLDVGVLNITVYALWEAAADVKLIFNGNGGVNKAGANKVEVDVKVNSTQVLANIQPKDDDMFRKAGFHFVGWTEVINDESTMKTEIDILTSSKEVFAFWRQGADVMVIFNGNGGVNKLGNTTYGAYVKINSTQILADIEPKGDAKFRKAGFNQVGWTKVPNDPKTIVPAEFDVDALNVTLYALWEAGANVMLIFDANGGENKAKETSYSVSVKINSTQYLGLLQPTGEKMFKKPGHHFLGWSEKKDDKTTLVNQVDIENARKTVYAYWEPGDDVMLIFNGNGGVNKLGRTLYTANVQINSTQVLATVAPTGDNMFRRPGYNFVAWTTKPNDASTVKDEVEILTYSVTVYALWVKTPDVMLIFDGNGGKNADKETMFGVEVPVNSTQLLSYRQPTGAKMFTRPGYKFVGWTEKKDDETTLRDTVEIYNLDVVVYALWDGPYYVSVTFYGNGGTNLDGDVTFTADVLINSTVDVADIEPTGDKMFRRSGYAPDGWTTIPNVETTKRTTLTIELSGQSLYVFWKVVPKVQFTFDGNGGINSVGLSKVILDVPGNSTQIIALLEQEADLKFIKPGYKFVDWTDKKDDKNAKVEYVDVGTDPVTVWALWEKVENVQVIFDGNGGLTRTTRESEFKVSVEVNSKQIIADIVPKAPNEFILSGHILKGWSLTPAGNIIDVVDITLSSVKVYAQWQAVSAVQLIFNPNGGARRDGSTTPYSTPVDVNSTVKISDHAPAADLFRKAGFELLGWAKESTATTPLVNVDIDLDNVILYAVWKAFPDVQLIFDPNGGVKRDGTSTPFSVPVKVNQTVKIADYEPKGTANEFRKAGFRLIGWSTNKNATTAMAEVDIEFVNVTVFAVWEAVDDVQMIFNLNGGIRRDGTSTPFTANVKVNQTVKIADYAPSSTEVRKAGFELLGWALESTATSALVNVDIEFANVTLYAVWKSVPDVQMIFDLNGGVRKDGTSTPFTANVKANQTVKIADYAPASTDIRKAGFELLGWALTDTAATPLVNLDIEFSNVTLYAVWKAVPDVQVFFNPNGGAKRDGSTASFPVTVKANWIYKVADLEPKGKDNEYRKAGYKLLGWGDSSTSTTVMTEVEVLFANVTLYAIWEYVGDVQLIFNGNGGIKRDGSTTPYSVPVPVNSTQKIADFAPAKGSANEFRKAGYKLAGWSDSETSKILMENVDIEFTNVTVYAVWEYVGTVELRFNPNGGVRRDGSTNPFIVGVLVNQTIILADYEPTGTDNVFRKAGFELIGWSTDKDATTAMEKIDIEFVNVTVYAVWKVVPNIQMIFDGNGAKNKKNQETYTVSVPANQVVQLKDYEPKDDDMFLAPRGMVFDGWTEVKDDPDYKVTELDLSRDDVKIYALWSVGIIQSGR